MSYCFIFLSFFSQANDSSKPSILDSIIELRTATIISSWARPQDPVIHQTLDEKYLQQYNRVQDIPYVLQSLPSTVATSDGGSGVGYTGIRIRGLDPTQINVLINGVPLNDAESQSMYLIDLPDLIASASEIQVQRGIGYSGSGEVAFGSSILINTNKIQSRPSFTLENAIGSFNTFRSSIQVNSGLLKNTWNIRGRISKINSDGYIDRAWSKLISGNISISKIMAHRSINLHIFDGLEKTYQAWNGVPEQYLYSDRTYNSAGTEKTGEPYSNQIDHYRQTHFQLIHHEEFSSSWSMANTLHYTPGGGYYEEYKAKQSPDAYNHFFNDDSDLVRRRNLANHFFGSIHSVEHAADKTHLQFGGSWNAYLGRHYDQIIQLGNQKLNNFLLYRDEDATKYSQMLFGKLDYKLNSKVNLIGDLQSRWIQYTYIHEKTESKKLSQRYNFINPKLGMSWMASHQLQFIAFTGIAHREPNREDLVKADDHLPRPERLWDNEIGLRVKNQEWTVEQNFYYMDYKNQLIPTGKLNDVGAYIRTNVDKSHRLGTETLITYHPTEKYVVHANLNLSQNRTKSFTEYIDDWDAGNQKEVVHTSQPIAFSPGAVFNLNASYSLIHQGNPEFGYYQHLNLGAGWQSISKQYVDGTGSDYSLLKGYGIGHCSLSYEIKHKRFPQIDVNLFVNNITNKKYESNGWIYRFQSAGYNPVPDDPYSASEGNAIYHQKGFFPQAGRNFILSTKIRF